MLWYCRLSVVSGGADLTFGKGHTVKELFVPLPAYYSVRYICYRDIAIATRRCVVLCCVYGSFFLLPEAHGNYPGINLRKYTYSHLAHIYKNDSVFCLPAIALIQAFYIFIE